MTSLCIDKEVLNIRYDGFKIYGIHSKNREEYEKALAKVKSAEEVLFGSKRCSVEELTAAIRTSVNGVCDFMRFIARNDNGNYALTISRYKSEGKKIYSDTEIMLKKFIAYDNREQTRMCDYENIENASRADAQLIISMCRTTIEYIYQLETDDE